MSDRPFQFVNGEPVPRKAVVRTFADAVRVLAAVEQIKPDTARKRVLRAEKEMGFDLPRAEGGYAQEAVRARAAAARRKKG